MKKIFFSSLILISLIIIIYISLNSNFRRSILSLSSGLINNYFYISINNNLNSEKSISKSIKLLERQIKFTDFLTTNQKNSFIDNIYLNLYLIEENLITEKNLLSLSHSVKKLISKDPNIYDALIWNAKIMNIENKDKEKIYEQIDQAIKLSPARNKAYRFAIDYSKKNNDRVKFEKYCKGFHKSFLGSHSAKKKNSLFSETSLTRFAIQINTDQDIDRYIVEGLTLNDPQDYFVDFKKPFSLEEFKFLSNFFPGILIIPINIELRNSSNEVFAIKLNDILITSKNSFFIKNENKFIIFVTSKNDEKITFRLPKKYDDINQLKIKMNFLKANITNLSNC